MQIRRNDMVKVIAGKDKGKTGRVERVLTEEARVVVDGVNVVTRHYKARPGVRQAGRVQQEGPIHVSNVMLICNKCNQPTRTRTAILETGRRVRSCPKCKEVIDDVNQ